MADEVPDAPMRGDDEEPKTEDQEPAAEPAAEPIQEVESGKKQSLLQRIDEERQNDLLLRLLMWVINQMVNF
jgi:hypothetical protein